MRTLLYAVVLGLALPTSANVADVLKGADGLGEKGRRPAGR